MKFRVFDKNRNQMLDITDLMSAPNFKNKLKNPSEYALEFSEYTGMEDNYNVPMYVGDIVQLEWFIQDRGIPCFYEITKNPSGTYGLKEFIGKPTFKGDDDFVIVGETELKLVDEPILEVVGNIWQKELVYEMIADDMIEWIREYATDNNMKKAILGISGGKDSTVVAMLLKEAIGAENVYGVLMPNGNQTDISDSYLVCDTLKLNKIEANIEEIYTSFLEVANNALLNSVEATTTEPAEINVAPRSRNALLYLMGQSLGARVAGTGNLSELTIGYFTKFADTSADFAPLANLTKEEVVEIGKILAKRNNLPSTLIEKTPSDGLWGVSDEDKIGISYEKIGHYIKGDYNKLTEEEFNFIHFKYLDSKHKRNPVPSYQ